MERPIIHIKNLINRKVLGVILLICSQLFITHSIHAQENRFAPNNESIWHKNVNCSAQIDNAVLATGTNGELFTMGTFQGTVTIGNFTLETTEIDDPFNFAEDKSVDIFISKQNTDGKVEWVKQLKGGDNGNTGTSILVDENNNTYLTGVFYDSLYIDHALLQGKNRNAYLIKLSKKGDLIWAKTYNSTMGIFPKQLAFNSNGDVVVFGSHTGVINFENTNLTENENDTTLKTFGLIVQPNGKLKKYEPFNAITFVASPNFIMDAYNNVYIAGKTKNAFSDKAALSILKYNEKQQLEWKQSIPGDYAIAIQDLKINSAQQLYIVGGFEGHLQLEINNVDHSLKSEAKSHAFLLKLSNGGQVLKAAKVFKNNEKNNTLSSIAFNAENEVYLTGTVLQNAAPNGSSTISNLNGASDAFVIKLDAKDELLWMQSMNRSYSYNSLLLSINFEGELLLSGKRSSAAGNNQTIYQEKIREKKKDSVKKSAEEKVTIYPNPFTSALNIELTMDEDESINYCLMDVTGKEVLKREKLMLTKGINTIQVKGAIEDLTRGIYFLMVHFESGKTYTNRVVKSTR